MKSLLPAAVLLAATLPAQTSTSRVIPPEAATAEGNSQSYYMCVYDAGIAQQVISSWAICQGSALINQVDVRADGTGAYPARSYSNLKFYIGYALTTPTTMSTTFASNRGTVTKHIDAAYTLPSQSAITGLRAFNIPYKLTAPFVYLPAKGDLLLEWEVPGTATAKVGYLLDAVQSTTSSGAGVPYGKAGSFSVKSSYAVSCGAPGKLVPGGSIVFQADGVPLNNGSLAFLGFSRTNFGPLPLPLDLTGLGASGNWLNTSVDLVLPLPLSASGSVFAGSSVVPIPQDNTLPGLHVYMQGLFADSKANKFGFVFSQGVDMGIVSGQQVHQLVGNYDTMTPTGNFQGKGHGNVVQLVGVFN